jgi:hypothetical protein
MPGFFPAKEGASTVVADRGNWSTRQDGVGLLEGYVGCETGRMQIIGIFDVIRLAARLTI